MKRIHKYKKALPALLILLLAVCLLYIFCSDKAVKTADEPSESGIYAAASPLSGVVIVIDPGHGGYDCGAVGTFTGVLEKDLNLAVSLKLRDIITQSGAAVIMTREADVALCDPWTPFGKLKQEDMARRAAIIDEADADIVLSIHMNTFTISRYYGAQVFCLQGGSEEGNKLAESLQSALVKGLNNGNTRKAKSGDYFILRMRPASVLIECGFLSNKNEEALLNDGDYQSKIAWCIYAGVADYLVKAKQP